MITNLRLDPFERMDYPVGTITGSQNYFAIGSMYEFWRFVFVQQEVPKLAKTAIDFPPMQHGASFNLEAGKGPDRGRKKGSSGPVGIVSDQLTGTR